MVSIYVCTEYTGPARYKRRLPKTLLDCVIENKLDLTDCQLMCPIIARIMFLRVLRACMQHGLPLAKEGVGVFRRFRRWIPRVYSNQSHRNLSYCQLAKGSKHVLARHGIGWSWSWHCKLLRLSLRLKAMPARQPHFK